MTLQEKYEKQKEINKDLVYYNDRLPQAVAATKGAVALAKENAELKRKIGIYQKGMYDEIEKRDKKLTKAIEIIKGLLSCCRNYPQENAEKMKQAEQFLKEIEK